MMTPFFIIIAALILDRLFGEPKCFHPLIGFGLLATRIENSLNQDSNSTRNQLLRATLVAVLLLSLPLSLIGLYLSSLPIVSRNPETLDIAKANLLTQLADRLGSWPIAHASRYIAALALQDTSWQQQCRNTLIEQSNRLQALLCSHGLNPNGSCTLFQWIKTDKAKTIHYNLAQQGILTRVFSTPSSLRFGLAKTDDDWQRLHAALQQLDLP